MLQASQEMNEKASKYKIVSLGVKKYEQTHYVTTKDYVLVVYSSTNKSKL